jgi:ribonuclease HI
MKYALRLQFQAGKCTNNIAEYEEVLLGLHKLKALGAQKCVLRTDSKVVADHIEKESSTRDPDLAEYLNSV